MCDTDYSARDRIVCDVTKNFFVEAGAGSGKTTMLVSRMVAMVESGIDVGKICAITFTKAAAGEFYNRFQKMLSQRANAFATENAEHCYGELPAPTALSRERCAEALRNVDLCFMGTIDSFCNTVLSEHPARAKIPSNAAVRSDDEMETLYKRAYSKISRGEYGPELHNKYERFKAFNNKADEVFAKALDKLMRIRDSRIVFGEAPEQNVNTYLHEKIAAVKQMLEAIRDNPGVIKAPNAETRKAKEIIDNKMNLLLGEWEHSLPEVIDALKGLSGLKIACEPTVIGIEQSTLFIENYNGNTRKIDGYVLNKESEIYPLSDLQEYQYSVTMEFLCECADCIAKELRKTGDLTFNDYLLYLRDMLKEDASNGGVLIKHIFERHSYYLIDEFQDTNPLQAEIFFYLTAKEPKEKWTECLPKPGSLFIVGDPKQSIYRFREADVSSFLQVRELFCGEVGEVLSLQRNFRSTRRMCTWFNRVFSALLPEQTENQSKFNEIPLGEEANDGASFGGVYTYNCGGANGDKDEKQVADIISLLVGNPSVMVKGKEDEAPRAIRYDDFMLITPTKTGLADYMKEFTDRKIPFQVEGKVAFGNCPALLALSAVFSAVAYPNDKLSLYAALTSGVFGIDDNRLCALQCAGYPLRIYREKENDTDKEVGAVLNTLKDIVFRSEEMPSSVLFCTLLDELHILEKVGTSNLEYLYFALELVRAAEVSGEILSLQKGADYLAELLSKNNERERSISLRPDANRVHIANLHKVKGLEAEIVILAGRTPNKPSLEKRTERTSGEPVSYLFSIANGAAVKSNSEAYKKEGDSLAAERDRLLYVAATRARRALIIGCVQTKKGEEDNRNAWKKLLPYGGGDFFESCGGNASPAQTDPQTLNAEELRERSENENITKITTAREKSYELCRPSMLKLRSIISSEDDFEDSTDEENRSNPVRRNAALIGTMVHRLMELMVTARHTTDLDSLVSDVVREYDSEDKGYAALLKEVGKTIKSGGYEQANGVPQDILAELLSADEVHCEVPFCYREETNGVPKLWNGVMDVLYRKGESWHIVDYKTNAEANDLDEKYVEQLNAYIRAFKQMTRNNADALIYHITV